MPAGTSARTCGHRASDPPVERLAYDRIAQAIVERSLPPGTKLREEALCDIFAVSRARVRKVPLRLAHDKAVELLPNRGAYVARPSANEAREVFTARRIIESHVVARVAAGRTHRQQRRLARQLSLEQAAHQRRDRRAAIRLSGEFHLLLAQLAGNACLERFLRELASRSSLVIALYGGPGTTSCPCHEPRALLHQLGRRRARADVDLINRHLQRIEAQLSPDGMSETALDLREVLGGPRGGPVRRAAAIPGRGERQA